MPHLKYLSRNSFLVLAVLLLAGSTFQAGAAMRDRDRDLSPEQRTRLRNLPVIEQLALDDSGVPTLISGRLGYIGFGPVERSVHGYIASQLPLFRGNGDERFRTMRVERDEDGLAHLRLGQEHRGLPIVGAELTVHVKENSGEVTTINGKFVDTEALPASAAIAADIALASAMLEAGVTAPKLLDEPVLTYVVADDGSTHLAWSARVAYTNENQQYDEARVYADAVDGRLAAKHGLIWHAKSRSVYDAGYDTALPGTLLLSEGGSTADFDGQKVYEYLGNAYDYYTARHSRDSWNGSGGTLIGSVHYGSGVANAAWTGSQIWFGDGDASSLPWGRALDLVAHEMTHGVTQATANLNYSGESGALNEGMSDIFGAGTEAYVRGTSSATWKLFEDIWTPGTSGDAVRYMNNPTQDGSSKDYYPERYTGGSDNGGVHWNSGIANLAFYLMSQGGTHPRGKTSVTVPSIGMVNAEKIFYRALRYYMGSTTNFQGARDATLRAASELGGGNCGSQFDATMKAWDAVGVPKGTLPDYEPNDTLITANTLSGYSAYAVGYLCTSGNADWYVINKINSYSTLYVSLYPPAGSDYDLELWRSSMYGQSINTGNGVAESISWGYDTGNFYIKVVGKGGAYNTGASYSLSITQ
jgi:vibriolysin